MCQPHPAFHLQGLWPILEVQLLTTALHLNLKVKKSLKISLERDIASTMMQQVHVFLSNSTGKAVDNFSVGQLCHLILSPRFPVAQCQESGHPVSPTE